MLSPLRLGVALLKVALLKIGTLEALALEALALEDLTSSLFCRNCKEPRWTTGCCSGT